MCAFSLSSSPHVRKSAEDRKLVRLWPLCGVGKKHSVAGASLLPSSRRLLRAVQPAVSCAGYEAEVRISCGSLGIGGGLHCAWPARSDRERTWCTFLARSRDAVMLPVLLTVLRCESEPLARTSRTMSLLQRRFSCASVHSGGRCSTTAAVAAILTVHRGAPVSVSRHSQFRKASPPEPAKRKYAIVFHEHFASREHNRNSSSASAASRHGWSKAS